MNKLLHIFLALLCYSTINGQTISGTILDEITGQGLIGANIIIENTSIGASTDFNGKYQVNVDPGSYTLVATYLGYADKSISEVLVKEGEITYLDLTLSDASVELDLNVTVTAKAIERTENAIMMLQRKSDKIQDGISSQEMSKFSVGNAAGAMKKVTGATVEEGKYVFIRGLGDRYSTTQLNGLEIPSTDPYRNSAQLDLIPANLLENIITSKTFTADQPGYFTGGNVDIKTKSFPEQFEFTINLSSSFNPKANLVDNFPTHQGGNLDHFGFDQGYRDLPDIITRIAYHDYLNDQSDNQAFKGNKEAAYALDQTSKSFLRQVAPGFRNSPLNHGISLSFGNQYLLFGKPLGVILAASFKQSYQFLENFTTANWRVLDINSDRLDNRGNYVDNQSQENPRVHDLVGISYKFNEMNEVSFNFIYSHNSEKTSGFIEGERPDNITRLDDQLVSGYELSFVERELANFQLSGQHVLAGLYKAKIEWKGSYVSSSQNEPQTRFFEYIVDIDDGTQRLGSNDLTPPTYFFRELSDEQFVGKLDLTFPIGQNSGNKLKFGGMVSLKNRFFDQKSFQLKTSHSTARFRNLNLI